MAFRVHAVDKDYALFSQHLPNMMHGVAATHSLPPPLSDGEAIRREIIKEKIRHEILAKEMLERKILEEEVRRELEIERIRELRRFHMERFSMHASNTDMIVHGNRPTQSFMPAHAYARAGACLRQESAHDPAEFAFRDRSSFHLLQKKPVVHPADSSLHHKLEKDSPSEETTTSNHKLSSAKKKARVRSPAEKQWGCALCQIISTSEKDLNDHLRGKKHNTNVALLNMKATIHSQSSKKNVTLQPNSAVAGELEKKKQDQVKGASNSRPGKEKGLKDNLQDKKHNTNEALLNLKTTAHSQSSKKNVTLQPNSAVAGELENKKQDPVKGALNSRPRKEKGLKDNLQGKKHNTNQALLNLKTTTHSQSSKKNVTLQLKSTLAGEHENKKQQPANGASDSSPGKEHGQQLYCGLCKVKCNSKMMLEAHYNGKRHKSLILLIERVVKGVREQMKNAKT